MKGQQEEVDKKIASNFSQGPWTTIKCHKMALAVVQG